MLITIEGIDGSGKGTQTEELMKRLKAADLEAVQFSFPQYGKNPFGTLVGRYLNGDFGKTVAPELAALLYSGDRFVAAKEIQDHLDQNQVVVCDRYIDSNRAHQVARCATALHQETVTAMITEIEYQIYRVPQPDLVIYLDMSVDLARGFVTQKLKRRYTDKAADLHEADGEHLRKTKVIYEKLIANYNDRAVKIQCCRYAGPVAAVRPVQDIADDIWNAVIKKQFKQ